MNLTEAKELLKAGILTEGDLDALLAAERERCATVYRNMWTSGMMPNTSEFREAIEPRICWR